MGVSKNRGKTPKMDGEHNGKPYEQMDDLGGNTTIFGNSSMFQKQYQDPKTFTVPISLHPSLRT